MRRFFHSGGRACKRPRTRLRRPSGRRRTGHQRRIPARGGCHEIARSFPSGGHRQAGGAHGHLGVPLADAADVCAGADSPELSIVLIASHPSSGGQPIDKVTATSKDQSAIVWPVIAASDQQDDVCKVISRRAAARRRDGPQRVHRKRVLYRRQPALGFRRLPGSGAGHQPDNRPALPTPGKIPAAHRSRWHREGSGGRLRPAEVGRGGARHGARALLLRAHHSR